MKQITKNWALSNSGLHPEFNFNFMPLDNSVWYQGPLFHPSHKETDTGEKCCISKL